jgi:hypothetical protein
MADRVKNLRDGQLVVKDGSGTPKTITVLFATGDLQWTEAKDNKIVMNRGSMHHARTGNDVPLKMSFSAGWVQLIGKSVSAGESVQLLEILTDRGGSTFASTGSACEPYQLTFEFTVADTCDGKDELVSFVNMMTDTVTCQEGDEQNTISYSGTSSTATYPTITRV